MRSATSEPLSRARISPNHGSYLEDVAEHTRTAGLGEELGAEADQATRRHEVLEAHPAQAVVDHALHLALAGCEQLRHRAEVVVGDVDRAPLDRFATPAVDLRSDDLWLADRELEAFTPHRLDQHRELQLAACLDVPRVGPLGGIDADADVADQFGLEPVLHEARRHLGSVTAGER